MTSRQREYFAVNNPMGRMVYALRADELGVNSAFARRFLHHGATVREDAEILASFRATALALDPSLGED